MTLDSIDLTLWLGGTGIQIVLLGLLVWKRVYRTLPIFFFYVIWCLSSAAAGMVTVHLAPGTYLRFSLLNMALDELFHLAILVELARAVLRYNRASSQGASLAILLFAIASLLVWSLAKWMLPTRLPFLELLYVIFLQLFAILRVASLFTLVWWTNLQRLRWPSREFQIVTGLGIYAIVSLAVVILHTHKMTGMQYHWLDQILVASYLSSLAFWVLGYATKGAEER